MQRLFNVAALEGGYYNTAALDGGAYNTAALEGGSDLYDDAALVGGFALASLATADAPPSDRQLIDFGSQTMNSLPPTVRDTIAKIFQPKTNEAKMQIYAGLAMLYLLDSLKALSVAPEVDFSVRKMARQRWVIMQRYLHTLSREIQSAYNRLLRYMHIPYHGPLSRKRMAQHWLRSLNNRSNPWGHSSVHLAFPRMPSARAYPANPSWTGPYVGPPVRDIISKPTGKKRKRSGKKKSYKKPASYTGWADPSSWDITQVMAPPAPPQGAPLPPTEPAPNPPAAAATTATKTSTKTSTKQPPTKKPNVSSSSSLQQQFEADGSGYYFY